MKYILFLFLLATTALSAQNVANKTTYTTNNAETFYEITRVNFKDSTYNE